MDLDDVKLCALFMRASGVTTEKEALLARVKKQAKLYDWQVQEVDEFCHQNASTQEQARLQLKTYLEQYYSANKWKSDNTNYGRQFREVLWALTIISYGGEARSKIDIAIIREFASTMKIRESYLREFEDIAETERILAEQRYWIEEARLLYEDGKAIDEQISKDEEYLRNGTYDLIMLG